MIWSALLPDAVAVGSSVPWTASAAIDHFGDPDGERVALFRGETLLLPRVAIGHLRLTGADRVPFLHGLVSQDVAGLPEGGAVDALLLDHRGQPQAGLGVVRRAHDLFLAAEEGSGLLLAERLAKHLIFDDVRIQTLDDRLASVTLCGPREGLTAALEAAFPGAGGALERALAPADGAVRTASLAGAGGGDHGGVLLRPRPFGPSWSLDVHLLQVDLPAAWAAWRGHGLRPIGERAWTAGRVAYGIATPFAEGRLGLPQETGLEARVHYRKGCYLGQEIMARIEARGRLRRGLQALRLADAPPGLGVAGGWSLLGEEGATIGAVVSAAPAPDGEGWWALGVLRHEAVAAAVGRGWPWRLRVDGPPPRVGVPETRAELRDPVHAW
jgi:tRNA-modifying protein YgfZ